MKLRVCLLFLPLIFSCNNDLRKSILEPLETDMLADLIKKDSNFVYFYEEVSAIRTWLLSVSQIEQALYMDVTYDDLRQIRQYWLDTTYRRKQFRKVISEYNKKYSKDYSEEVDSVLSKWRKYWEKYQPNQYVDVEFFDYEIEGWYFEDNNVRFRITPKLGEVLDKVVFKYCIRARSAEDDGTAKEWSTYIFCDVYGPIYTSIIRKYGLKMDNPLDYRKFTSYPPDNVEQYFNFNIQIEDVEIGGISVIDSIPDVVLSVLKDGDNYNGKQYGDIIRDVIDTTYISMYDYVFPKVRSIETEKICGINPKCMDMMRKFIKTEFCEEYLDYVYEKYEVEIDDNYDIYSDPTYLSNVLIMCFEDIFENRNVVDNFNQ